MPQLPPFPSVFPIWWVAATALIGVVASFAVLRLEARLTKSTSMPLREAAFASLVVGLSIFAWRLSGNIPELNEDPIGALSPNDWLCPVVTYVFLGIYAAYRRPIDSAGWAHSRAMLTATSFVVNVVTI